jgi:lipopolysaccharide heptosyltransferase II
MRNDHRHSASGDPPARVLIVLLGAIGDVVRALPLLQRLKIAWPATRFAWAVEPAAAPILLHHPALDETLPFRRESGVWAFPAFLRQVRAWRPELCLDLQRHFKSGLTSWYSGARVRLGFAWRNSREGNWLFHTDHIAPVERFTPKFGHYLRFADHLGVAPAPISFGLRLQAGEEAHVSELLHGVGDRFAALFVGSTWPSRSWFPEPTAALCRALEKRGLPVVLLGTAEDEGFVRRVAAGAERVTSLAGRTSLREVIGVLSRATVAVGPDSGPMHIAAAVGTPVVSLWGATSPARSVPWGAEDLVVQGEAPCVPCYRKDCPIGRLCMQSITVETVLERVTRALEHGKARGEDS